jgi:hypothetical protein
VWPNDGVVVGVGFEHWGERYLINGKIPQRLYVYNYYDYNQSYRNTHYMHPTAREQISKRL